MGTKMAAIVLIPLLKKDDVRGRYEPLFGFWGKAQAAKRFPGYYRGLRERWMRESRCYFFCQKVGVRVPPVPPVSYAYV